MVPLLMVCGIVVVVVVGLLVNTYIKHSKEHNRLFRTDMTNLAKRMDRLEADMADLKELVSDTIIDQS